MRPVLVALVLALLAAPGALAAPVPVEDVARASGIAFDHATFHGQGFSFFEATAGGACWGDYDRDGLVDLYVTDWLDGDGRGGNRLYRNAGPAETGTWRFVDVTNATGTGLRGLGQGCVWGDYDNDGWPDLYATFAVTEHSGQGNVLLRNRGGADFEDVTAATGVDGRGDPECAPQVTVPDGTRKGTCWSVAAAWLDYDLDGDLDLYVTQYAEFGTGSCVQRYSGNPVFCKGQPNRLYRNDGDEGFTEVGEAAGVAVNHQNTRGRSLAVVATDVNGDTWPDLYVANDKDANALYVNDRDGSFTNVAVEAGVTGYGALTTGEKEEERAGMGVDAQDFDDDGRVDLVSTHLRGEYDAVYRGLGDGTWTEVTTTVGVGEPVAADVSRWGAVFADLDLDGRKDLLIAAGGQAPAEGGPVHLLLARGDGFAWQDPASWPFVEDHRANHRQVAVADYDNDGDVDAFVSVLPSWDKREAHPKLLRFDYRAPERDGPPHAVRVTLTGTDGARDVVGAHVVVQPEGGPARHAWTQSGGSYAGSHDPRLVFGLGNATRGTVAVTWPGGATTDPVPFDVAAAGVADVRITQPNRAPPAPVAWVDEPAWSEDGTVTLTWTRSRAADFAAYRVVVTGADAPLTRDVTDRDATTLVLEDVPETATFAVRVVDTEGHVAAATTSAEATPRDRGLPGPGFALLVGALAVAGGLASRKRA